MPSKKPAVSATMYVVDDYSSDEQRAGSGQNRPIDERVETIESLYNWHSNTSELKGIIEKIVTDVFGEGYDIDGSEARIKKVRNMLVMNKFNSSAKAVLRDMMITGDGYMGLSMITRSDAMKFVNMAYENTFHKSADFIKANELLSKAQGARPDIFSPRGIFPLSSRSMFIDYDRHGNILGYVLRPWASANRVVDSDTNTNDESIVGTPSMGGNDLKDSIRFEPDEILHFTIGRVGDSVYGTSPLQTAMQDVVSLFYAKRYGALFFKNDATPSRMYFLKNESPTSKNYNNFKAELEKHRRNPHRNLVFTGEVESKDVNPLNKDLEFGKFIDNSMRGIMMAYGCTERFNHLFTGKPETPQNLEGYYKLINSIQADIEEVYNSGLFSYFDVEFSFRRTYKRDESREADIVNKLVGVTMSVNEGREYTGYKPLDGEEYNRIVPRKSAGGKSEAEAADARDEQNNDNPSAPGKAKDDEEDD